LEYFYHSFVMHPAHPKTSFFLRFLCFDYCWMANLQ